VRLRGGTHKNILHVRASVDKIRPRLPGVEIQQHHNGREPEQIADGEAESHGSLIVAEFRLIVDIFSFLVLGQFSGFLPACDVQEALPSQLFCSDIFSRNSFAEL
jgi:hypothetical protein